MKRTILFISIYKLNPMKNWFSNFWFVYLLIAVNSLNAQQENVSDSLTFNTIIERVVNFNPLIKQAQEKINTSQWKEKLTQSTYLPTVSASATVSRIYPIPAFDLPLYNHTLDRDLMIHMQMIPDFSAECGIKITQLIYDFGKTKNNLVLNQLNTDIDRLNVEQLKQQLSLVTAGYFFTMEYIQSAITIKNEELKNLQEHLKYIEKKQQTGSATTYEVLSTKVRISATENQLSDLQNALLVQTAHLNMLMDTTLSEFRVKDEINPLAVLAEDSLIQYAFSHRDDAQIMEKKMNLAKWNYQVVSSDYRPTLMFIGTTGYKNGYLPSVNDMKFNYMAGISLNVPIYDANRKNIKKQMASSEIANTTYEKDNLYNSIAVEIHENFVSLLNAQQKIVQYTVQLQQAQKAYENAQVNYSVGAITNLDLLDASNNLAETKLLLLKAQIDYKLYYLKLQIAIGKSALTL